MNLKVKSFNSFILKDVFHYYDQTQNFIIKFTWINFQSYSKLRFLIKSRFSFFNIIIIIIMIWALIIMIIMNTFRFTLKHPTWGHSCIHPSTLPCLKINIPTVINFVLFNLSFYKYVHMPLQSTTTSSIRLHQKRDNCYEYFSILLNAKIRISG